MTLDRIEIYTMCIPSVFYIRNEVGFQKDSIKTFAFRFLSKSLMPKLNDISKDTLQNLSLSKAGLLRNFKMSYLVIILFTASELQSRQIS